MTRLPHWNIPETLTIEQRNEARKLRATGRSGRMCWRSVAKIMGIPERRLLAYFCPDRFARTMRTKADNEARTAEMRSAIGPRSAVKAWVVPEWSLAERDRRLEAMAIAEELCQYGVTLLGDPPPGFSALDKKHGSEKR